MDQNDIDVDWARRVTKEITDELVIGKILDPKDVELAAKIVAQEIYLFLVIDDRPQAGSRAYPTQS